MSPVRLAHLAINSYSSNWWLTYIQKITVESLLCKVIEGWSIVVYKLTKNLAYTMHDWFCLIFLPVFFFFFNVTNNYNLRLILHPFCFKKENFAKGRKNSYKNQLEKRYWYFISTEYGILLKSFYYILNKYFVVILFSYYKINWLHVKSGNKIPSNANLYFNIKTDFFWP